MKLSLLDKLALAKAGYKMKDIEAMEMSEPDDDKKDPEPDDNKNDPEPDDDKKGPEPDDDKNDPEPDDPTDYKKLYEDLLAENEKAKDDNKKKDDLIKKIQKKNTNDNILPDIEKKREDDINSLKDSLRGFY